MNSVCLIAFDVGSVSIKAALLPDETIIDALKADCFFTKSSAARKGRSIFLAPYRRLLTKPLDTFADFLVEIKSRLPKDAEVKIILTGSAGRIIANKLNLPFIGEFKALANGASLYGDVSAVMEMGGECSRFIKLEKLPDGALGIADYGANGDCAAGTGSFMDQQSTRLSIKVEDIGGEVANAENAAKIAGRCSVFAKSDMIHAQQKGAKPGQVLKGLCEAVARNYKGTVAKGQNPEGKALFVGGVAKNAGVADALRGMFDQLEIIVPDAPEFVGAMGALASLESGDYSSAKKEQQSGAFSAWAPLSFDKVRWICDEVAPKTPPSDKFDAYLGVDIGSVSTNLVLVDTDGNLVEEIYLRTRARPVEVVTEGLKLLKDKFAGRVNILGVGTTGSGRELIGELIGADTINDEITAHKTGAFQVANLHLGEEVDTIFEIGGQDAKFISLKDGVVVDFTMNEACAAGTGSFLEEQAEKLGVSIYGEFTELAMNSSAPLRLGERCTVYMESDVANMVREGAPKEDIVAGLAYSVVQNYLNRVVRGRKIGDVIFFQGGTAYNRSVSAAFSKILGKRIMVPPFNGVMGAYGCALLARDKMTALGTPSGFRGFDLDEVKFTVRGFSCNSCDNRCDIQEFDVEGKKSYWGDKCSEKFRKAVKTHTEPVIDDLFARRDKKLAKDWFSDMLLGEFGAKPQKLALACMEDAKGMPKKTVGMIRAMYYFDRFPFWRAYFTALGAKVVTSAQTTKKITDEGVGTAVAEPCFPIQSAHGHLADLVEQSADLIVVPAHINAETNDASKQSHSCPWGQTLPFVLAHSQPALDVRDKLVSPIVHFREGREFVENELWRYFSDMAKSRSHHKNAVQLAYLAQDSFDAARARMGEKALETLEKAKAPAIILVGRPYNIHDPGMNLNLVKKLRQQYGINVIPMDCLPKSIHDAPVPHPNMYWNYGRRILRTVAWTAQNPNLHIIYITNFKCGPDSYVKTFSGDVAGKPFLTLQFDSHGNDAGMMTRCEAYLDSKGFLRWWKKNAR